jgi:hypothetical protein
MGCRRQGAERGRRCQAVAWMRMMGAESVEFHRRTVLERGDDYPGMALSYYASRGETQLRWGGTGAEALGLTGPVASEVYGAMYGPGGDPPPLDRRATGGGPSAGHGTGDLGPARSSTIEASERDASGVGCWTLAILPNRRRRFVDSPVRSRMRQLGRRLRSATTTGPYRDENELPSRDEYSSSRSSREVDRTTGCRLMSSVPDAAPCPCRHREHQ